MESRYIPEKFAGKQLGPEGRLVGLVCGTLVLATSPIYVAGSAIGKIKEVVTGVPNNVPMRELTDVLGWCYEAAVNGKLPERAYR